MDVPADGEYTFYTSSDDGSQLFIGSTLVVDNNGAHGLQERAGKIGLLKGKHAFTLTFFENAGAQLLTASYAGPGLAKTQIPAAALFRTGTATTLPAAGALRAPENPTSTTAGLTYQYYEGTWLELPNFAALTPTKTGTTTTPTLDMRNRDDDFAVRYTGFVDVPADGEYTFYTSSDDGSQLFIGSTLVVDNNGAHGLQERAGKIGLLKGKHAFTLTFFENAGAQLLTASYAGPGLAKTQIPAAALFRAGNSTGTGTTASTFYRAINLNGPALTLDGNAWEGRTTTNFWYAGNTHENQGVALVPATDADRARMIRSFVWGGAPSVTLSAVPTGDYDVYVYVWEDNNSETFSIKLDGKLVLSNHQSGSAGSWQKLGPWRTTVANGTLTLSTQGGAANLSGLEVWRAATTSTLARQATTSSLAQEEKLALYPNPSSSQVYLGTEASSQVIVRDSYGRVRLTQDQANANTPLDTSALPNGIYTVEARSATGRTLRNNLVVAH
ncbi:T9SS type A sorting domain-containing protein [Hymenobacter setariae]|uniref:T9SS type A sorting domain-containing protein n=1 Tax=Hymenobacter setariae TaxID=2594794 RepID=A0A558BRN0_9BACT|nr:T9SS type A sorting domain-containing protein [Hymenobacter setariae]